MAKAGTPVPANEQVKLMKPPSRSFDEKLTEEERTAFYDHSSDRAMAIVIAAIIENHLTALLRLLMRRDEKLADELFRPTGPLGPFGTKIRIAYMLRTFSVETYKDLICFTKIRNRFAHDLSVTSFENQAITDWVRSMHFYTIIQAMAKTDSEKMPTTTVDRAKERITKAALESTKDGFRMCARFMVHQLVDYETSIKLTESELNK